MDIFDNDFVQQLEEMWKKRKAENEKEILQKCSDMLFKYLANHFKTCKDVISCMLKQQVKSAERPRDLQINIWTYVMSTFEQPEDKNINFSVQALGLDDTICGPDRMYQRRVVDVIRKTDILARLSLLFGKDFIVMNRFHLYRKDGSHREYMGRLVLQYHPNGKLQKNNPTAFAEKQDAEKKYLGVFVRPEDPVLDTKPKIIKRTYRKDEPTADEN